jgi:hypothetical protein
MHKQGYINKKSFDALMYDNESFNPDSKNKKENLIENEHVAWEQNFQLENAKRSAFEIEDIGNNVARNLDAQTNQFKNMKGRQMQLEENLDQGDFFIESMHNQENKKKRNLIILGVLLLAILLIILLIKFI